MKEKWYKNSSNWFTIIACVILIPILVINCSILIQAKTHEDKIPSVFGYKPFIVLSDSMENKIRKGDLIFVGEVNVEKLKKDDIIAFRDNEDTVTTHRIIDIVEEDEQKYFVTKGDNNSSQDQSLVEGKDVEGIFKFRIAGVGNILNSLAQPTTIVIIVLGITIIFGLAFYASTKKQRKKEHEEFLEYKRQQELEKKKQEEISKKKSTSKDKTVKATKKNTTEKKTTKEKSSKNK